MTNPPDNTIQPGTVFQITEGHDRKGWIGAFITATEVNSLGIEGYVQVIQTPEKHRRAFVRLPWSHIDYIGMAVLVPAPEPEEQEPPTKE